MIVGERGVGKTSLVSVASAKAEDSGTLVVRVNCPANATFAELWGQAFKRVKYTQSKRSIGFDSSAEDVLRSLAETMSPEPLVGDVLAVLGSASQDQLRCAFVFDEFDRLNGGLATQMFADLIKGITDHNTRVSIVLVGIADSVTDLFDSHASIERSVATIPLRRMTPSEIRAILIAGVNELDLKLTEAALAFFEFTSRGFPHVAHALGLHACRDAIRERRQTIDKTDGLSAMTSAVAEADHSLRDRYMEATSSPRPDATFRHVLTACALTQTDYQGFFRPAGLAPVLAILLGKKCTASSVSDKLERLCETRGNVLTRRGISHRYRYRFSNPMMESYVLLRGFVEEMITPEIVGRCLETWDR